MRNEKVVTSITVIFELIQYRQRNITSVKLPLFHCRACNCLQQSGPRFTKIRKSYDFVRPIV